MKKSIVFAMVVTMLVLTASVTAQESVLPANADKELIEENLFIGLATDNTGLQRSAALMLGKILSDRAVIPLMETLHNNPDGSVRSAAAWSLCKIGDPRGTFAVKMSAKFDESNKVQAACAWYYENFIQQGTFTFKNPEYNLLVASK